MRERLEPALKIACLVLVALLFYQLASIVRRSNPLSKVTIPELPTLSSATTNPPAAKTTNAAPRQAASKSTNAPTQEIARMGTNTTSSSNSAKVEPAHGMTNSSASIVMIKPSDAAGTKPEAPPRAGTNSVAIPDSAKPGTSLVQGTSTNKPGTNAIAQASTKGDTNSSSRAASARKSSGPDMAMMAGGGMPPGMPGSGRSAPADLAPPVKARVFRIYDSEILGPIMRPQPMALLGIAGETVFLRAPNGQTGLVKVGDELGGLKLLQIGINRILVEQEGEKKELTMFNGYGSESLLPK